ncbi:MAG: hypothetical protein JXA60_13520 [Candidatus Coatesbacteria bacterium]|nr:hypothetical protein [Candidatus Coatesbacteria bacterium]
MFPVAAGIGIWISRIPFVFYLCFTGLLFLFVPKMDKTRKILIVFAGLSLPLFLASLHFKSLISIDLYKQIFSALGMIGFLILFKKVYPLSKRHIERASVFSLSVSVVAGIVLSLSGIAASQFTRLNPFHVSKTLAALRSNNEALEDAYKKYSGKDIYISRSIAGELCKKYEKDMNFQKALEAFRKGHLTDNEIESRLLWKTGKKQEALAVNSDFFIIPANNDELNLLGQFYLHNEDFKKLDSLLVSIEVDFSDDPYFNYLKGRLLVHKIQPSIKYMKKSFPFVPDAGYYIANEMAERDSINEVLKISRQLLPYNMLINNELYFKNKVNLLKENKVEIEDGYSLLGFCIPKRDIVPHEIIEATIYLYLDRDQWRLAKPFLQFGKEINFLENVRFAPVNLDSLPQAAGNVLPIEVFSMIDDKVTPGNYQMYFSIGYDKEKLLKFKEGLGKTFQIRLADVKITKNRKRSLNALYTQGRYRKLYEVSREYDLPLPLLSKTANLYMGGIEYENGNLGKARNYWKNTDEEWQFLADRKFNKARISVNPDFMKKSIIFPNGIELLGYKIISITTRKASIEFYFIVHFPQQENYIMLNLYDEKKRLIANGNHYLDYSAEKVKNSSIIKTAKTVYYSRENKIINIWMGLWNRSPWDDPIILDANGDREIYIGQFRTE